MRYLLELALCRSSLQDVRDGNCRIAVGEVRVVSPSTDCNPESVPGNSGQGHVMVLPDDTFPALKHKIRNVYVERNMRRFRTCSVIMGPCQMVLPFNPLWPNSLKVMIQDSFNEKLEQVFFIIFFSNI